MKNISVLFLFFVFQVLLTNALLAKKINQSSEYTTYTEIKSLMNDILTSKTDEDLRKKLAPIAEIIKKEKTLLEKEMDVINKRLIKAGFKHGTVPKSIPIPWKGLPGRAKDIGVGANGTAWVIGTNKVRGGYGIYRWNGRGWQNIPGGAIRIDVGPRGNAGIVNKSGVIFLYNGKNWQVLPGKAKDIGIGANGAIWVIGTNKEAGGYGIYRWHGRGWQKIAGSGVRIDVDEHGNAWIVNKRGDIFRFDGKGWQHIFGKAKDIGVGGDGTPWVIGTYKQKGGFDIYRWTGFDWKRIPGGALQISVDNHGLPWVVNSYESIIRHMPFSPIDADCMRYYELKKHWLKLVYKRDEILYIFRERQNSNMKETAKKMMDLLKLMTQKK
ncbi:tectonin domain-containing protein [Candidatus Riflebacteria bacterium]